ncbi:C-X-C motif chemokine 11-6-like [Alosa sapidissima]|uniref:C-X-C motif chemokine 11-6-like n=1 Tax=Alosa sapidissima TaxID=34773 RepID=UPI001C07FBC4|nr:C-X-C motif chemokine 11-6-like [Alosa sapidissima]
MKSAALLVLLAALLFVDVRGQLDSRGRCKCQGAGVNAVRPNRIERLEVLPPSSTCPNLEIIVTLKENEGQKCLNPESSFAKNFIKKAIKKRSTQ